MRNVALAVLILVGSLFGQTQNQNTPATPPTGTTTPAAPAPQNQAMPSAPGPQTPAPGEALPPPPPPQTHTTAPMPGQPPVKLSVTEAEAIALRNNPNIP